MKYFILFTILFHTPYLFGQIETDTIDFAQIEFTDMIYPEEAYLKFDFRVIDSASFANDTRPYNGIKPNPKLTQNFTLTSEDKAIQFPCTDEIKSTCHTYMGYTEVTGSHLITTCNDVCFMYLVDVNKRQAMALPSFFDGGSTPLFTDDYLMAYSSYPGVNEEIYYEEKSIIEVFSISKDSAMDIGSRYTYIGGIDSKNWLIESVTVVENNKFAFKVSEKDSQFKYFEIEIE